MEFGINLIIENQNIFDNSRSEKERTVLTESFSNSTRKLLKKNTGLSATEIMNDWFKEVDADIFISHSHKDKVLAGELARFIENETAMKSFLDWNVWGNCDNLLEEIDDQYCVSKLEPKTYSYEQRNNSTSHVHIMLLTSLLKMMKKSRTILFLNTENSLLEGTHEYKEQTKSPWLYFELEASRILAKDISYITKEKKFTDSLKINYDPGLEHLMEFVLNENSLSQFLSMLNS